MRISMLRMGACVAVLGCSVLGALAENDTPAQAAARAALIQRMNQADGTTNQPAANPPSMNEGADTPVQAAARAALLKRMQEEGGNQAPVIMVNNPPAGSTMTPDQTKAIAAAAAQANAKKEAAEQSQMASQKDADAAAKAAALRASYPGKELGFAPPAVPPSPITPAKQERLDKLLIQYKMNQISPEAYHTQRAAILAEP